MFSPSAAAETWQECKAALAHDDDHGFTFSYYALALAERWPCYELVGGKWIDRGADGWLRWAVKHGEKSPHQAAVSWQ